MIGYDRRARGITRNEFVSGARQKHLENFQVIYKTLLAAPKLSDPQRGEVMRLAKILALGIEHRADWAEEIEEIGWGLDNGRAANSTVVPA